MRRHSLLLGLAMAGLTAAIAACGGGGGGGSSSGGGAVVPSATATPTPTTVSGTVVEIPTDAYGPTVMGAYTYASADATTTAALTGATVVIGPIPITGATPPAPLPSGDVATTTNASGAFTASITTVPAAPSSAEPFVVPPLNILNITPPATGYYVEVFGMGTDGLSAGVPIPLHRFVAAGTAIALRVSTTSTAEASALTAVNSDRAANGAGPLIFDESAEEVARLHASDESAVGYTCHYDTHNVGPASRYLAVGGIGLTGEGLALAGGATANSGFQVAEAAFLAEKTESPPGAHYLNVVDVAHLWAGLASVQMVSSPGFWNVDYDFITPDDQDLVVGAAGYTNAGVCPSGTVVNQS